MASGAATVRSASSWGMPSCPCSSARRRPASISIARPRSCWPACSTASAPSPRTPCFTPIASSPGVPSRRRARMRKRRSIRRPAAATSRAAQVNVLDAPAEVLAALPGMTPDRLQAVLQQRTAMPQTPQNGQVLLSLLGEAQSQATIESTKTIRVAAQVRLDSGRQLGAEVVIYVPDADSEPYNVLSWRDGLDE